MTENEALTRIGHARRASEEKYPDLRYRSGGEFLREVSDNLSWLHWAWTDPDGMMHCMTDLGALQYRQRDGAAYRAIKASRAMVLVDGVFYK